MYSIYGILWFLDTKVGVLWYTVTDPRVFILQLYQGAIDVGDAHYRQIEMQCL